MDREELRRKKFAECEAKTEEVYQRLPRLREIEEEIKKLSFQKIQQALLKKKFKERWNRREGFSTAKRKRFNS